MMLLYPANFAIATSNCHFNPRNGHDQEPLPLSVLSPRYSINNPMLSKETSERSSSLDCVDLPVNPGMVACLGGEDVANELSGC